MAVQFAWDPRKARANERRHGVAFVEAITAFHDPLSITIDDPLHSLDEERFLLIGLSTENRLIVIAHRDDGEEIRIISARRASRRERRTYEEESGR